MRKYKKRELCDCIYSLKEANRKMNMFTEEVRAEMLPQCQEMAIAVGTAIEQSEGEGTKAVSYLEEYCEELYLASNSQDRANWKASSKKMDNLLNTIQNSIRYDLKDSPSEIVFMPYKASMWDALDSVYRAAIQEENCHVVVMPIPYFNINRKDQRLDMHYEGNLFPTDIPITDYQMYDLAKERPDVIFIHNPYDAQNHVTQVPEEYFSSKLVEYTEHLVYIPYFITRGDKVKDIYCVMPAVQNAWRTFVQSRDVRKCYLQNGADPEKIVAMGSPKFDMVIRMQENPPKLPETWKKALNGRKVFLLNTHLNPIINEAEKLIDKLHQIFELFRKRETVALLWRPHPLSIETAKAMNPKILGSYLQLIEEFKTLSNGVYDESPDVHRAIAVSDAYVGDWSSLVTLYGITGKPIYITNINNTTNIGMTDKELRLSFSYAVEVDGYLWASADQFNGLFKICVQTGESEFVASFDKENPGGLLYRGAVSYGRKLFFVPYLAKSIAEYNIDTKEMRYYQIKAKMQKGSLFTGFAVQDHKLFLFPHRMEDIVTLDMEGGQIQYYDCNYEALINNVEDKNTSMFASMIRAEDCEYMPCFRTNMLIKFNLVNYESEVLSISIANEGLCDVTYDSGILYILSVSGDIYAYDTRNGEVELFWTNMAKGKESYGMIIYLAGFLWLLPDRSDNIYRVDVKTRKEQLYKDLPQEFAYYESLDIPPYRWLNGDVREGKMILYPRMANMMLTWDSKTDRMEGIKVNLPKDAALFQDRLNKNKGYLCMECEYPLSYFVDRIEDKENFYNEERREYFCDLQLHSDGTSGVAIWEHVKKEL